ncbi:MAG: hypothetical protein A3E85_00385 [Gammaproteobacteria bacterium RIFCSPHIGHO2_12_FULL_45_12]|nr:MAG: hypothetical protein A3E85_00385 [Gammaproteobacteria bacterium RIFCSPHIGHO2_12_FULL_45_12]
MYKHFPVKTFMTLIALAGCLFCLSSPVLASGAVDNDELSMDRVTLVSKQIDLLKNRYQEANKGLLSLQQQHDLLLSHQVTEKASKRLLDKVSLDIAVAKSSLDSIDIEVTDSERTMTWLDKSIQEIENQMNVLSVFGSRVEHSGIASASELQADLKYQKSLLNLEKLRADYLKKLQKNGNSVLQIRLEDYSRLDALLKSHQMLHVRQAQVKDELAYQEQQNRWLEKLSSLNAALDKLDPAKSQTAYAAVEREIYDANENANYAYVQALIARYKNQVQQMKISVFKSTSMSLLNQVSDQVVSLSKQMVKLDEVLQSRMAVLQKHISDLSQRKSSSAERSDYLKKLSLMAGRYHQADKSLQDQIESLSAFRKQVDKNIQVELSAREGFPGFGYKTLLDIRREVLLVPSLSFKIFKSVVTSLMDSFKASSVYVWALYGVAEALLFALFVFLRGRLRRLSEKPSAWHGKINSKWLVSQFLKRNFVDIYIIGNVLGTLLFFDVPVRKFLVLGYLCVVWLVFKAIITVSQLCLIETTHDTSGHDVRLYHRLKWIIMAGGIITACTVVVHQLPLIFELRILCDMLFLFFLVIVSALLLRSWEVVPNLIISHMDDRHPYFHKIVRLVGILIPILMLTNSLIGLFGYLNLVMTISWYEGVFMLVLIAYLVLRGLLTDGMIQLSNLVIQYTNNGWLWTEAFLKPIDKVLRIALFLMAWTTLFLFYGWDGQSPIVERLTRLLHYQVAHVLNSAVTPLNMIELLVAISIFYWTAKWTREFVYRLLVSRTQDLGIRNSMAILSQYTVVLLGVLFCLRVLGIDLHALVAVAGLFAFAIGLGLRDLANNFACGFLILLERPLRVGDMVSVNGVDGEVTHIGGRAVTISTWDHTELVVPNVEIFNKSFTNLTAKDNVLRSVVSIKAGRYEDPHFVQQIIMEVLLQHHAVLRDPAPDVFLKQIEDTLMEFELRYYVDIKLVKSRPRVISLVLLDIWDAFSKHGIKTPFPQHKVLLQDEMRDSNLLSSNFIKYNRT